MNPTLTSIVVTLLIGALTIMFVKEYRERREGKSLMKKLDVRGQCKLFVELQEQLGLVLATEHTPPSDPRWSMTKLNVSELSPERRSYYMQKILTELQDPSKHADARKVKENPATLAAMNRSKETKEKMRNLSRPRTQPRTIAAIKDFK